MFCVLEIHRMSIHNGPGIRTMVHFKGCPLRCAWCSTPESQSAVPQLLYDLEKCNGCGNCVEVCKTKSISVRNDRRIMVDWNSCSRCLDCTKVCNVAALRIAGQRMDVEDLYKEIVKDQLFYETSGGGVVFSGGEPMTVVNEAFVSLLQQLKEANVSVGIDTSGYAPQEAFERILPYIDYFLWDMKQMDSEKHMCMTGVDNAGILHNLQYVSDAGVDIYLRCPIIKDYTDEKKNFEQICQMAQQLKTVKEIHLLPMHHMGDARYDRIGMTNLIANKTDIEDTLLNEWKLYGEKQGFIVRVIR